MGGHEENRDALWTAEFQVRGGWTNGGGVVVENGGIFGGGRQYWYAGRLSLNQDGESISGHLKVVHYHGERAGAFGDARPVFSLEIQGAGLLPTAIFCGLQKP